MKSRPNPRVEWYFEKENIWLECFKVLRDISLETGLTEELKWGHPCYSLDGNNVFLMHGFKNYCALMFMKGVSMDDSKKLLIQQTENEQSRRQIRFESLDHLLGMRETVRTYMQNAIEVERSGAKVEFKKTEDYATPEEFQEKLDELPMLREAFEALTPGRQRGYKLYFSSAKQSKTRAERVEKHIDRILDGLGLDD